MSNYYRGDKTLSLTIPGPALPNWPLSLISADETGLVTYKVPYLDHSQYTVPLDITAAYVPGATLDDSLTGEQILALPGVVAGAAAFPTSFGVGLDQTVTIQLPVPLPVGPVVVVLLGRVA